MITMESWIRGVKNLEELFRYFLLTSEQKYRAQMRLVEKAYWWWKDSHIDRRDWFVLQDFLHTRYTPHLERLQFSDLVAV